MSKNVLIVVSLALLLAKGNGNIQSHPNRPAEFDHLGRALAIVKGETISNAKSEAGVAQATSISKTGGNAISHATNGTLAAATSMAKLEGSATATATGSGVNGTKANALTTGTGNSTSSAHTEGGSGGATANSMAQKGHAKASAAVGPKDPKFLAEWLMVFGKPYEE